MSIFRKLEEGVTTASAEESMELAASVARELPIDRTLALSGDLGTGKTVFVKGLARFWNIREPVTSPTYNLLSVYQGDRLLLHLDAYRLQRPEDADALLIDDFLTSPYCLAVEWPEKLGSRLPMDALCFLFTMLPDRRHLIRSVNAGTG